MQQQQACERARLCRQPRAVRLRPGRRGLCVRGQALSKRGRSFPAEALTVQRPLGEGSFGQVFEVSSRQPAPSPPLPGGPVSPPNGDHAAPQGRLATNGGESEHVVLKRVKARVEVRALVVDSAVCAWRSIWCPRRPAAAAQGLRRTLGLVAGQGTPCSSSTAWGWQPAQEALPVRRNSHAAAGQLAAVTAATLPTAPSACGRATVPPAGRPGDGGDGAPAERARLQVGHQACTRGRSSAGPHPASRRLHMRLPPPHTPPQPDAPLPERCQAAWAHPPAAAAVWGPPLSGNRSTCRSARGSIADFMGYCEVEDEEAAGRLTSGLWLVSQSARQAPWQAARTAGRHMAARPARRQGGRIWASPTVQRGSRARPRIRAGRCARASSCRCGVSRGATPWPTI